MNHMISYAVFYAVVTDDDEAGIFVDAPYFGGSTATKEHAEMLARCLTNDKTLPGTIIPKIYAYRRYETINSALEMASRQFKQMMHDMYSQEEMQRRMRNRDRKK